MSAADYCATLALPGVVNVTVREDPLSVDLEERRTTSVPIGWYPRLAHGTPAECANSQIVGAGYATHWPDLDENIAVEELLLGKKSTESPASFERWFRRRKQRQQPSAGWHSMKLTAGLMVHTPVPRSFKVCLTQKRFLSSRAPC